MTADRDQLVTARRLLASLGVRPEDLLDHDNSRTGLPTWAEYLPRVIAAAGPGANRTYEVAPAPGTSTMAIRPLWT